MHKNSRARTLFKETEFFFKVSQHLLKKAANPIISEWAQFKKNLRVRVSSMLKVIDQTKTICIETKKTRSVNKKLKLSRNALRHLVRDNGIPGYRK